MPWRKSATCSTRPKPQRRNKLLRRLFPRVRLMRVAGHSMAPLLNAGELVLIRERAFEARPFRRGELVAARPSSLGGKAIIKRLAGLPREELTVEGNRWRLNEEQFFLLGENLERSFDSRRFGPVTREELIGRVWARLWPWKVLTDQSVLQP